MATANHVLLRRVTLPVATASVTFDLTGITGYTDLKIAISALNTTGLSNTIVKFNNSSTGYTYKALRGTGTAAASFTEATWGNGQYFQAGYNRNGSSPSNSELYIPNYTSSNNKSISLDYVEEINGNPGYSFLTAGLWSNAAAITSIEFSCDTGVFAAGSSFSLYGIANAATTPVTAPKADGGDIIKTDGTYWYHAFLSTGVFRPQVNLTTDCLLVAGGGGGGFQRGSGGGGGGLLGFTSQALSTGTYTVTVGAGGAGGVNGNTFAGSGTNSSISGLTAAVGGGGGVNRLSSAGQSGGSGSGGAFGTGNAGGAGTAGQGYAGGVGGGAGGGGGGGAGSVGQAGDAGSQATKGNGGSGATYNTSVGGTAGPYAFINDMSSIASTGQLISSNYYYSGGGGSLTDYNTSVFGTGGSGGGGAGNPSGVGNAGTAYTGGGGGAGGFSGTGMNGGAGGSGVVIIRYPVA